MRSGKTRWDLFATIVVATALVVAVIKATLFPRVEHDLALLAAVWASGFGAGGLCWYWVLKQFSDCHDHGGDGE
jgi:hypothetical protein